MLDAIDKEEAGKAAGMHHYFDVLIQFVIREVKVR